MVNTEKFHGMWLKVNNLLLNRQESCCVHQHKQLMIRFRFTYIVFTGKPVQTAAMFNCFAAKICCIAAMFTQKKILVLQQVAFICLFFHSIRLPMM